MKRLCYMVVADWNIVCQVVLVGWLGADDVRKKMFNRARPFDELALAPCGSLQRHAVWQAIRAHPKRDTDDRVP